MNFVGQKMMKKNLFKFIVKNEIMFHMRKIDFSFAGFPNNLAYPQTLFFLIFGMTFKRSGFLFFDACIGRRWHLPTHPFRKGSVGPPHVAQQVAVRGSVQRSSHRHQLPPPSQFPRQGHIWPRRCSPRLFTGGQRQEGRQSFTRQWLSLFFSFLFHLPTKFSC